MFFKKYLECINNIKLITKLTLLQKKKPAVDPDEVFNVLKDHKNVIFDSNGELKKISDNT